MFSYHQVGVLYFWQEDPRSDVFLTGTLLNGHGGDLTQALCLQVEFRQDVQHCSGVWTSRAGHGHGSQGDVRWGEAHGDHPSPPGLRRGRRG